MKRMSILVVAAAIAGLVGFGPAAAAGDAADCEVGAWTGAVDQPGSQLYSIRLDIDKTEGASGVGFTARTFYPELACGGDGVYLGREPDGRLAFNEIITANRQTCIDGRFTVVCLHGGALLWRWFYSDGDSFEALLRRR